MTSQSRNGNRIDVLIGNIMGEARARAPSLIVTVLGDAIAPRGGRFWIGSLIEAMAPFGLNDRLVRTAIFRLTREDWLIATQMGRRSYYSLTRSAIKRFDEAFHRVYEADHQPWTGEWTLAMVDSAAVPAEARERIRRELTWAGFGIASAQMYAHATLPPAAVRDKLADLGILDGALVLRSRIDWPKTDTAAHAFVRRCWDLDQIASQYARFLDCFRPLWQAIRDNGPVSDRACFMIRTLLIHEYRRLTLRDPQLPRELTATDWEGSAARTLTRNIYRRVTPGTEEFLTATIETAEGPLPAASRAFHTRFDDLD
ncbi:MAG: phenylacetic acid degradation operon negative regulatory protein PaaX [Sphingomonadales bacterium]